MEWFTQAADTHDVIVRVLADAGDQGKQDRLVRWYMRNGFEYLDDTRKSKSLIRYPSLRYPL